MMIHFTIISSALCISSETKCVLECLKSLSRNEGTIITTVSTQQYMHMGACAFVWVDDNKLVIGNSVICKSLS